MSLPIGNPKSYIVFSDKVRLFYDHESLRLEELGLKAAQARVLHFLSDFEGLSQQEACTFFNLRPSTMSGLLSSVENEGYIYRETNPRNKRMVMIHLTKKGRETAREIYTLFEQYCSNCLEGFTSQEIEQFESYLLRFAKAQ